MLQWSSGSMSDCGALEPVINFHHGQSCACHKTTVTYRHDHRLHTFIGVPSRLGLYHPWDDKISS